MSLKWGLKGTRPPLTLVEGGVALESATESATQPVIKGGTAVFWAPSGLACQITV